jgi:hypothetical protein
LLDLSDAVLPDGLEDLPEGQIDIPEDSVVDTESSDGQGHVFDEDSDGDHEKDEDYVMDDAAGDESDKSDSEEEFIHQERMNGKGKVSCFFHLLGHRSVILLPERKKTSERRLPQRYQQCPRQLSHRRKYRY